METKNNDPKVPSEDFKYFELKLTEMEVQSGSLAVTWCLTPELIEDLGAKLQDSYILLITAPPTPDGRSAEWRGYAKLSDLMAYVMFHRPGLNRIYACITSCKANIQDWMGRSPPEFGGDLRNVIHYPGSYQRKDVVKNWEYKLFYTGYCNQDYIDVDIPSECFAKEPSKIEKKWVNWLWKYDAIDQCDFRKRRVFAYTIQPIAFLAILVFRFIIAFGASLLGCKNVGWGVVYKPFDYSTWDSLDSIDGNWLVIERLGKYKNTPCTLYLLLLLAGFIGGWGTLSINGALIGIVGTIVLMAFILVLYVLVVLAQYIYRFLNKIDLRQSKAKTEAKRKIRESKKEIRDKKKLQDWERENKELLLCSRELRITSIVDLPKKKRTIKLRFTGLKSMVCRPFSR